MQVAWKQGRQNFLYAAYMSYSVKFCRKTSVKRNFQLVCYLMDMGRRKRHSEASRVIIMSLFIRDD